MILSQLEKINNLNDKIISIDFDKCIDELDKFHKMHLIMQKLNPKKYMGIDINNAINFEKLLSMYKKIQDYLKEQQND